MANTRPKYSLIAEQLLREVRDGRLPVGSQLPTEAEMMRAYGVSRHTVRAAIRDLKSRGIVASRQGQGSTVISAADEAPFAESIQSVDQLIAFGQETRRELLSSEIVAADEETAALLQCAPGRRLCRARMVRRSLENDRKIALVTLWLDALLEEVVAELAEVQRSAAEIIRDRYGLQTNAVVQSIMADRLDAETAGILDAEPGGPALVITRAYSEAQGAAPFLVAVSVCRADAFRVVSTFVAPR